MTEATDGLVSKLAEANSLYSQWRLVEADIILREIREVPGKHQLAALNLHADILWSLSDLSGAKQTNRRVLDIDPLNAKAMQRSEWLGDSAAPNFDEAWAESFLTETAKPHIVYPALVRLLNSQSQHRLALTIAGRGLSKLRNLKTDRRIINKLRLEVAIAREGLGDINGALASLAKIPSDLPVAVSARASQARLLHELGRFAEAEAMIDPPRVGSPAFNNVKYHVLLSTGRMQEAFDLYRSRRETEVFRRLVPNYQHVDVAAPCLKTKTALLMAEGGPGDELRMSTLYAAYLKIFGALSASCDPRLKELLSRTYPEIQFVPSSRSRDERRKSDYSERDRVTDLLGAKLLTNHLLEEAEKADVALSVFDGLSQLRLTRGAFLERRNLKADPALVGEVADWLSPAKRHIGLAWRSLIVNTTRNRHYLEVSELRPLAEVKNTQFWILQPGVTQDEIEYLSQFLDVRVPGFDLVDDFDSQAALISCLDAVIAPCTTTAELAGALGARTFILANSNMTVWRRNPDGSDVWHPSAKLITPETVGHTGNLVKNLVMAINGQEHGIHKTLAAPLNVRVHGPMQILRKTAKLARSGRSAILHFLNRDTAALRRQQLNTSVKNLLRQKDVIGIHINAAHAKIEYDRTGTMAAVKAALQFRAGRLTDALQTASELKAPRSDMDETALIAIRNDLADLGRHDYAIAGLRALLRSKPDPNEDIRVGNALFEQEAFTYLSNIPNPDDRSTSKGYVVIFGLNNRVSLGLMTPIAHQLAADGYHVCAATAAAMPKSLLPELDGISASIRWSGMALTDEPYHARSLRNNWRVDLAARVIECDGINYFTFFAERLSKLSNRYEVDASNPKVLADLDGLLRRSDCALTVCKRLVGLAQHGKPIRLAAMDTHFAPAGIVRQWCEEVGASLGIELVALSISYENYFSNLSSIEARTISVENMTSKPDLRHPLFGGRKRFDRYLESNPSVEHNVEEVLAHIRVNRSKVEEADQYARNDVITRIDQARRDGRKVFAALGKVLIDFAAPYDRGRTFRDFREWIRFMVDEISQTENLLLIKPHPHERRTEIASSDVETLRDLLAAELPQNVIFLDHASFNSFELAEMVDAAFVWNGTAYAEFQVLDRPIAAESIWAERDYPIDGTILVGVESYRSVLRGERTLQVSPTTKRRATAYIQFMKSPEVAIPFGYLKRAGTNQSIGASAFIPQDMKRVAGGWKDPNLKLAASRFFEGVD